MQLLEVGVVTRDVAVLAADHAERRVHELARDLVRVVREREAYGLREERVAGEERDALAERNVGARPPAALVVVVERGQVVVDERERVDELERRGGGQRVVDGCAVRLCNREAQHRSNALSSRLERVAEHLVETAELGSEGERAEVRLDGVPELVSRSHRRACARASARSRSGARARRAPR